jgi:hypothetical protein
MASSGFAEREPIGRLRQSVKPRFAGRFGQCLQFKRPPINGLVLSKAQTSLPGHHQTWKMCVKHSPDHDQGPGISWLLPGTY